MSCGSTRRLLVSASKHRSAYDVLGVRHGAGADEAKVAFKRRALLVHPDVPGGSDEEFMLLHEAYEAVAGGRGDTADWNVPPQPPPPPQEWWNPEKQSKVDMSELPEAMFLYRNMVAYAAATASTLQAGTVLVSTARAGPAFARGVMLLAEVSARGGTIGYLLNKPVGGPNGHRNHRVLVHTHPTYAARFAPRSTRSALGFNFDTQLSQEKLDYLQGRARVLSGFCGWGPGILDALVGKGRWRVVPPGTDGGAWLHSTPPDLLYDEAMKRL